VTCLLMYGAYCRHIELECDRNALHRRRELLAKNMYEMSLKRALYRRTVETPNVQSGFGNYIFNALTGWPDELSA